MRDLSYRQLLELAVADGATTPAPSSGRTVVWSTTLNAPAYWDGAAWRAFSAGGGVAGKRFSAPVVAGQSVNVGVSTTITSGFGAPTINELGTWSAGAGALTISAAGVYLVTLVESLTSSSSGWMSPFVMVNGADALGSYNQTSATGIHVGITGVLSLAAGDVVTGRYYFATGTNTTTRANATGLSITRIA